jgi:hypothetical protein
LDYPEYAQDLKVLKFVFFGKDWLTSLTIFSLVKHSFQCAFWKFMASKRSICRVMLRGRSQTTLTRFWLFLTTYPTVLKFSMVWTLTKSGNFWTNSTYLVL